MLFRSICDIHENYDRIVMRELDSLGVSFSEGYGLFSLLPLGGTAGTLVASCRDPPETVLAKSVGGRLSDHSMPATIAGGCRARETRGGTGARDMAAETVVAVRMLREKAS